MGSAEESTLRPTEILFLSSITMTVAIKLRTITTTATVTIAITNTIIVDITASTAITQQLKAKD